MATEDDIEGLSRPGTVEVDSESKDNGEGAGRDVDRSRDGRSEGVRTKGLDTVDGGHLLVAGRANPVRSTSVGTGEFDDEDIASTLGVSVGIITGGNNNFCLGLVSGGGDRLGDNLVTSGRHAGNSAQPGRGSRTGEDGRVETPKCTENTGSTVGTKASLFIVNIVLRASVGVNSDIRDGPSTT